MGALVISFVLAAVSMRADPPVLTHGKDRAAAIEVAVSPAPSTPPALSTDLGQVSTGEALGGGRFRFQYTPPKERFPSVALLLAQVPGTESHAWLALPIRAPAELAIETKPRASVEVTLAGQSYGPLTADGRGKTSLLADVPPGVTSAEVRATDRAGNTTVKPLEVPTTPFARLRALAPRESASWADPEPLPIEVFAIEPDGKPAEHAELTARSRAGAEIGTATALGGGVYRLAYRAPTSPGEDQVAIQLSGSAIPATVSIHVRPGPPGAISLALEPVPFAPGAGRSFRIRASVSDGRGNPLPEVTPEVTADFGTLIAHGSEATLELPSAGAIPEAVTVRARAGAATTEVAIPLTASSSKKVTATAQTRSHRLSLALGAGALAAGIAAGILAAQVSRFETLRSQLTQLPPGSAVALSYGQAQALSGTAAAQQWTAVALTVAGGAGLIGAVLTW